MALHDRDYYRSSGDGGDGFSGRELGSRLLRLLNWTFPIGTYLGIRVRVHITFLLIVLFFAWPSAASSLPAKDQMLWGLRGVALLFLSVLLHEFGHCLGCRSVGGTARDILMWPLGGLAYCAPPRRPWPEFVTVACGPLVTFLLAAGSFLTLLIWYGADIPVGLNPFAPYRGWVGSVVPALIRDLFVVNYILLLFNMVMVFYPFDGGRLVQIALWTKLGFLRSMRVACSVGMVGAVLIFLVMLSLGELWISILAAFGFVACYRQKAQLQGLSDYDIAAEPAYAGYGQTEKPGFLERVAAQRRDKAAQREADRKRRLQAEIDAILEKVHNHGLASLSAKEKRILKEGTQARRRG